MLKIRSGHVPMDLARDGSSRVCILKLRLSVSLEEVEPLTRDEDRDVRTLLSETRSEALRPVKVGSDGSPRRRSGRLIASRIAGSGA